MPTTLITSHRTVTCDMSGARKADHDDEARMDAHRCRKALEARFPGMSFRLTKVGIAHYTIETTADLSACAQQMFAEGFMASRDLWER
jgi:hypothetical protein